MKRARPSGFHEIHATNVQPVDSKIVAFFLSRYQMRGPSLNRYCIIRPSQRPIQWKFYCENYTVSGHALQN